jgi:hypothetical protein
MAEVLDMLGKPQMVLVIKECTNVVKRPKAKATVRNGVLLFTPNASQATITLPAASADPTPSSAQTTASKTAYSSTSPAERTSLLVIPNLWAAKMACRNRQASATNNARMAIKE